MGCRGEAADGERERLRHGKTLIENGAIVGRHFRKSCLQPRITTQQLNITIMCSYALKTTTAQRPVLISACPGSLFLAFTHSLKHTHTSLSFILKLDADLSYPPPTILSLQLPQALFPALPLSSPRFRSQHWPIHSHNTLCILSFLYLVSAHFHFSSKVI